MNIPKEVIEAFFTVTEAINIEPIGNGLINQSWKVTAGENSYFLQRINSYVFQYPEQVQENYLKLWQFNRSAKSGLLMPSPVTGKNKSSLFIDKENNYWRAFEFIPQSKTYSVAEKAGQANETAKTFGKFTASFIGMNAADLKIVITNFHNLSFRYGQFEVALKSKRTERLIKASSLVEELKQRKHYVSVFEKICSSAAEFPLRVMHHDAKISNILFDEKTGKVICPVDYDTVMPGYFFSDLGDMIRSMISPEDEKSTRYENIRIRKEFYEGIVEGYLEAVKEILTESEIKYLHYSGLLMIYMQALRFLTDYLNSDAYYKTEYEEQNYDRSKNQVVLLQKLESYLSNRINLQHG